MVKKMVVEIQSTENQAVFFHLKNVHHFPNLFFENYHLEYVTEHKHLGIQLSSNLSWSEHIDNIVKKAYKKLELLKKLKFSVSRDILSQMYLLLDHNWNMLPKYGLVAHRWT